MRAILLVKDKEGLNDDRLQNSRYGLTGKPALTQQGIAGALSASFKAGQQVTMSNLRSLNEKLREAQKALDNAQNNIDKTEDTQDKMDEAKDEISKLLSTGLWEKMWQGQISPFEFYTGKYFEDVQYEAMCGEPGFPVQNIGEFVSVAPIPRVPVWDPIISKNAHKIMFESPTDTDILFIVNEVEQKLAISEAALNKGSIALFAVKQLIISVAILTTAVTMAEALQYQALSASGPAIAAQLKIMLIALIALANLLTIFEVALSIVVNSKITEFGATSGRGKLFASAAPSTFKENDGGTCYYLYIELLNSIDTAVTTVFLVLNGKMIALNAIKIISNALVRSSYPWAVAIGTALSTIVDIGIVSTYADYVTGFAMIAFELFKLLLSVTSRNNGDGTFFLNLFSQNFFGLKSHIFTSINNYPRNNLMYNTFGMLAQQMAGVENLFVKVVSYATSIFASLFSLVVKFAEKVAPTAQLTEMLGNDSRIYIQGGKNTSLEDWWYVSSPRIYWNFNDRAAGVIGGGGYPGAALKGGDYIDMRAHVYTGDYFGTQRGIHLWEGKSVDRTIVIKAKAELTYNRLWYGFCVLVRFSGSPKLYLLMERDAVYGPMSFSPCTHCEQMIYNYNRKLLPMKQPYTSSRNGMLSYYYATITTPDSETTVQYRNVRGMKENWLEGQLINTEYTLGGDVYITNLPGHGYTEGYINSYADQ